MPCCGQKRTEASAPRPAPRPANEGHPAASSYTPAPSQTAGANWPYPTGSVRVRYVDAIAIVVQGSVTGHRYYFSAAEPVQLVDRRDAELMLRSRHFRREL